MRRPIGDTYQGTRATAATPRAVLLERLMDSHIAKSELEHFAARLIADKDAEIEDWRVGSRIEAQEADRGRVRIKELEAQQQWIPVSTPPTYTKDTPCLVLNHWGTVVDDWEPEYQEFEQTNKTATHWMPLPAPPTDTPPE